MNGVYGKPKKNKLALPYIWQGNHRITFDNENELVLKVVMGTSGIKQNKKEVAIFHNVNPQLQKYLCPIIKYGRINYEKDNYKCSR